MQDLYDSFLVNTLIAHRGLHDKDAGIPENSLKAFERAIKEGYAIECDVQGMEDGTPIVFHDAKLDRMTGQDGYTNTLTHENLKNYKLLNTDHGIPTFEEFLKLVDGKTPVLIEIKNSFRPGIMEKKVLEMLKNYKGTFAIMSFNPYVLNWFKNNAPEIVRGQLSSFFKDESLAPMKKLLLKRLKFSNLSRPQFIAYDTRNLPNRFVRRFKNIPLLAWTVKSEEEYLRVIKYCDNIIFEGFEPKI
ncbi:MAG: glycerophosphodiester phosphodiesterase [Spirochaetales bacterium]